MRSKKARITAAFASAFAAVTIGMFVIPGVREPVSLAAERSAPATEIGINLGLLQYWSQEFAFADLLKASGLKLVTPAGWVDPVGKVPMNDLGYPQNVPVGTRLVAILKSGGGDQMPSGAYECVISPGWRYEAGGVGVIAGNGERFTLNVSAAHSTSMLSISLTPIGRTASLNKLSCRSAATPETQDFKADFLADSRPFAVLRFMDWMRTNNQPPQEWNSRTKPVSFSQAVPNGVAVEHMVALANQQNADPWFNMPLEASDEYYRRFALYIRDNLRVDRRAYVEVSNEVWNNHFKQSKRATARGLELYPTETPVRANDFYYADRVRAVMAVWSDVFRGSQSRLVRVVATQAGNAARANNALSHESTYRSADALAIAPYFGPGRISIPADRDPKEFLIDQGSAFVDKAIKNAVESKRVADAYNLRFITYEGGPAYMSRQPNTAEAFRSAERDQRMFDIYTQFLTRWRDEVGGLFIAFDSISSQYGHQLYTGQPLSEAPKMRALVNFIRTHHLSDLRFETSRTAKQSPVK